MPDGSSEGGHALPDPCDNTGAGALAVVFEVEPGFQGSFTGLDTAGWYLSRGEWYKCARYVVSPKKWPARKKNME